MGKGQQAEQEILKILLLFLTRLGFRRGKNIRVARIYSGVHFFLKKVDDIFSRRRFSKHKLKTKTTK